MATHDTELLSARSPARRRAREGGPAPAGPAQHPLLRLQRQAGNAVVSRLVQDGAVQRQELDEEELQMSRDPAAPTVGPEGGSLSPSVETRINAARAGGSGLNQATRSHMEAAFGTSFADVRVHHDGESDALARSMTARAFTTGSDVFLRRDANPGDTRLIAHELTHVVQQRSMGGGEMTVRPAGDIYEQQADAVAGEIARSTCAEEADQA
jgi:hypothetical protein